MEKSKIKDFKAIIEQCIFTSSFPPNHFTISPNHFTLVK